MTLLILNRQGVVHSLTSGCSALRAAGATRAPRKAVTATQALVYKLPACDECWPDVREYEKTIGRSGVHR